MGIDHAVEYADALGALISDERVMAATITAPSPGLEPDEQPESGSGREPEYTWWSVVLGVFSALANLMPSPDWLEWVFQGRAAKGAPDSIAARLRRELKDSKMHLLLAVTDRWAYFFDVLDTPSWVYSSPELREPPEKRLRYRCRLERREIRTATAGWYRLNPGRLTVRFVDGSWAAFGLLMFMGRSRAKKLAKALRGQP